MNETHEIFGYFRNLRRNKEGGRGQGPVYCLLKSAKGEGGVKMWPSFVCVVYERPRMGGGELASTNLRPPLRNLCFKSIRPLKSHPENWVLGSVLGRSTKWA